MALRAVWFDVGETLIDESREYGTWADWLGVPRHTFSAVFGAVLARGGDYREAFQHFRPGFDLRTERQARLDVGLGEYVNGDDLYPDARRCLQALRDAGYFVGVAGNQTARAGRFLHELNLPCDVLATSGEWGVEKPGTAFFDKMVAVSGHGPAETAYVGDRLDNDIAPAARAGLFTIWLRRGPWGHILQRGESSPAGLPDGAPSLTVDTLNELTAKLTPGHGRLCRLAATAAARGEREAAVAVALGAAARHDPGFRVVAVYVAARSGRYRRHYRLVPAAGAGRSSGAQGRCPSTAAEGVLGDRR